MNRQRKMAIRYLSAAVLCCFAAASSGAATDDCRALADDARRLACYDQLFPPRDMPAQPATAQPLTPSTPQPGRSDAGPAQDSSQPAATPGPDFGFNQAQRRASGIADDPKDKESISATVTAVRNMPGGQFVVTLDNAQVWRQSEADWWVSPKKGDRVTISRGILGSFMLLTADKMATHVRRER